MADSGLGPIPPADPAMLPHNSHKVGIIVAEVVGVVIATLFVALRVYTRTKIVKVFALTDWFLLAALAASYVLAATSIAQAISGIGSHVWDVDVMANWTPLMKTNWLSILFYALAIYLVKLSFIFLYLNIFDHSTRARIALYLVLALVVFATLWNLVIIFTACIPLDAYWDPLKAPKAHCHSPTLYWVNTGLHAATDYLIFAVPLPKIWGMRLPRRQKVLLMGLFSLGFIVCFISIIRIIFLDKIHRDLDPDFTYAGTAMMYLTIVEAGAGIVVASCMTLKPLLNTLFPFWLQSPSDQGAADLTGASPPTVGTRPVRTTGVSGGSYGSNPELGMSLSDGTTRDAEWEKVESWSAESAGGIEKAGGEDVRSPESKASSSDA